MRSVVEAEVIQPNSFINGDCMEFMRTCPPNFFDLAIVDPPYGLGDKLLKGGHTGRVKFHELYALNEWDDNKPDELYFNELRRVSKNQIIWGANYYLEYLGNTRGIICWDKRKGNVYNFSHWEMAWTSFDCIARLYSEHSHVQGEKKIHPTQKPIKLYRWLLKNYAKAGDLILDTHVGSASSLIACTELGFDYVGFEIDREYYEMAKSRLGRATRKYELFEAV